MRRGFAVRGTTIWASEKAGRLGYFAKKGGWDALIADAHALRQATQAAYPGIPYFLGHSMGSFRPGAMP